MFALYLTGLDVLLNRLRLSSIRYYVLALICVVMLASEVYISRGVFGSEFNWFHMVAAGHHP
jgi:hypothetical protein